MASQRRLYVVYVWDEQLYDGWRREKSEEQIMKTVAVSEAQAIRNIKHRLGLTNSNMECYGRGYYRETKLRAVPVY